MTRSKASLVRCNSYDAPLVEAAVKKSVDLMGGIGVFIKPGEKVLIKPNLLTGASPDQGITTHPEVVRAVIRLVKTVTPVVYCGDSPSVWGEVQDIDRVYEECGIKKVCKEEGVELVYFTKPQMRGSYPLTDWLDKCDRFVSVPKFKTHSLTVLTAGVKNLFGLVVGMNKMKIHYDHPRPEDLCKALIDLYELKAPDLTILDGIIAMEGQGPGSGGTLRPMNLLAASSDALSLDMVLCSVMGISVEAVPTNREALKRGLGPKGKDEIDILGEGLDSFCVKDFKLPKPTHLNEAPRWFLAIFKQLLKVRISANRKRCRVCGLCLKSCPAQAMAIEDGRIRIDNEKCLRCLCCQEICPANAIDIKKNLLLQLLERLRG